MDTESETIVTEVGTETLIPKFDDEVSQMMFSKEEETEEDASKKERRRQLQEIVAEHELKKKVAEEELKKLPAFEQYLVQAVSSREDSSDLMARILWLGVMTEFHRHRSLLQDISVKNFGKYSSEQEEFKDLQREWWYYYSKISVLRAFALRMYDIRAPDWKEILPERYYCGVLVSSEDKENYERAPEATFKKIITSPPDGSGMKVLEPIVTEKKEE